MVTDDIVQSMIELHLFQDYVWFELLVEHLYLLVEMIRNNGIIGMKVLGI